MTRVTALAVLCGVTIAHADDKLGAKPAAAAKPDEIADIESREANLESIEPRAGFTFTGAVGGSITIGGDIGAGRGPAFSIRIGQVATRRTVLTFELVAGSALHKETMTGDTLTDANTGLYVGAQHYTRTKLWVRGAGGLNLVTKNIKPGSPGTSSAGVGGLVGAGLDVARWGYLVLGIETFAMLSVTRRDGAKGQLGLGVGLSYY